MHFDFLGWTIVHTGTHVEITKNDAPPDRKDDGVFDGYHRSFVATGMSYEQVWHRVFATLQFLEDHERRENFKVDGVRVLDPHSPESVTGFQQEWFIEHESALRGY